MSPPGRIAVLALRALAGLIFLGAGVAKLFLIPFASILVQVGVPFPGLVAWAVAFLEVGGGLVLLGGAFAPAVARLTRPFAALLALEMAAAMLTVGLPGVQGRPVMLEGRPIGTEPFRIWLELGLFLLMVYLVRNPRPFPEKGP